MITLRQKRRVTKCHFPAWTNLCGFFCGRKKEVGYFCHCRIAAAAQIFCWQNCRIALCSVLVWGTTIIGTQTNGTSTFSACELSREGGATMSDPNRSTSEMPVIPACRPVRASWHKSCISSPHGPDHYGHCDTTFICPECGHHGMRTKDTQPPFFVLCCPNCGSEKWIHWIEYDLGCPRCGNEHAFGTYTKLFERIIQCPVCGPVSRGEAA